MLPPVMSFTHSVILILGYSRADSMYVSHNVPISALLTKKTAIVLVPPRKKDRDREK
jgi:hypothetical protein